ncbi:MAG TPA: twin-arginine translocase TatA/TatE family subunit [Microbacterium sp.]|jgi:sec-independent protein translocase protein TatA|uniref:twin-arginine translocase TatA/TatE family subunit n=1 Tax=Microbacterium sp. TaxID=51671 RepID=UPI002B481EC1|nr:twin-arginine translocase TatA/TatE family subunit [Microbacterium sp.]HKT57109.1 twin-arginine translocase TatA/TatE family subunit [Microbacterium sp.]
MFAGLTGWHVLIIALVVLLLFGATKLPALARGVGQSMRIFKQEVAPLRDPSHTTAEFVAEPVAAPPQAAADASPRPGA